MYPATWPDVTGSSWWYMRSMPPVNAAESGTARSPSTARFIRLLLCRASALNWPKPICRDRPPSSARLASASAMRGSSGRSPRRSRASTSSGEIRSSESGANESNRFR
jgi:hypothetical protein